MMPDTFMAEYTAFGTSRAARWLDKLTQRKHNYRMRIHKWLTGFEMLDHLPREPGNSDGRLKPEFFALLLLRHCESVTFTWPDEQVADYARNVMRTKYREFLVSGSRNR
jgi:hypothetical protein